MKNQIQLAVREHEAPVYDAATIAADVFRIVVHNDEVNSFDWVIQSLVEVCEHTSEQAEQCAWIIHTKGRYAVKSGSLTHLKPRCEALLDRGLSATLAEA